MDADQKPPAADENSEGSTNKPAVAGRGKDLLWRSIVEPIKHPTGKQKESYARFLQTLSAACFIGATTIAFSGTGWQVAQRTVGLVFVGVVLFFVSALFAKGDI